MMNYNTNSERLDDRNAQDRRVHHDEIRLNDEWEVIYWCLVLRCTKSELEMAVRQYGNSPSVVRLYVGTYHPTEN